MKLTSGDIRGIPHMQAVGFDEVRRWTVTDISTDSRSTKRGDLFIAIRGDQFDGHNFVTNAVKGGAAAVIVDCRWAESNGTLLASLPVPKLIVENTVHALGHLANLYRQQFTIPIVAVGGSNGKTTTKEMIRAVLAKKYTLLATEGNLNNHIGVPLTLFRLEKRHEAAVVEIGTNHPGEIAYLCGILQPTHGLITNIGQEHLEFFGSLDGVADAEAELFSYLKEHGGTAIVNADDPAIASRSKKIAKKITFGIASRTALVKGRVQVYDADACATISVRYGERRPFTFTLSVPGTHNAQNALAAAAVGLGLRVPSASIVDALESFSAAAKRMQVQRIAGVTVMNDTYNANPDSVAAALTTLGAMKCSGKKIAVLADMLELGADAAALHAGIGRLTTQHGVDVLLTYGPLSAHTSRAASAPMKLHYDQKNILAEFLLETLSAGDVVLVKGSRGMKMEDVVTFLAERLPLKGQA